MSAGRICILFVLPSITNTLLGLMRFEKHNLVLIRLDSVCRQLSTYICPVHSSASILKSFVGMNDLRIDLVAKFYCILGFVFNVILKH